MYVNNEEKKEQIKCQSQANGPNVTSDGDLTLDASTAAHSECVLNATQNCILA